MRQAREALVAVHLVLARRQPRHLPERRVDVGGQADVDRRVAAFEGSLRRAAAPVHAPPGFPVLTTKRVNCVLDVPVALAKKHLTSPLSALPRCA